MLLDTSGATNHATSREAGLRSAGGWFASSGAWFQPARTRRVEPLALWVAAVIRAFSLPISYWIYAPLREAFDEVIYLVFGIINGLLLIRVVLKLLAANPLAGFSKFIYGLTDVFLAPFRNLLPTVGGGSGAVLEMSTVIAIIVYALIGWALVRLVAITFFRNVTVSRRSSRGIGGPRVD